MKFYQLSFALISFKTFIYAQQKSFLLSSFFNQIPFNFNFIDLFSLHFKPRKMWIFMP